MRDWAKEEVECELMLSNGMVVLKEMTLSEAMFLDSPQVSKGAVTIKISGKILGELFEALGVDVSKKV